MSNLLRVSVTLLAILTLVAPLAHGHHSHASLDKEDMRTYSGVVVRYGWTMPHVFLKVKGPDPDGKLVQYTIELNHPPFQAKNGWTRESFKPGDHITWYGPHDRNPERHFTGLVWAERGDGKRFEMERNPDTGQVVPSTDFTGLWKRSDIGGWKPHYRPPEGWSLTAAGQEMVDGFDEDHNPMVRCGNPGPPKSMIVPYPLSITRIDDQHFQLEREMMDEIRIVHLGHEHGPGEPSKLGYSIGRFDGDDLIVETTNFVADKWGTHTGIDSSEQKHLVERFSLAEGGTHLLAEITVTDPVYLAEPVTFVHRWKKLADRDVIHAPCTMESAQLYMEAGYEQRDK